MCASQSKSGRLAFTLATLFLFASTSESLATRYMPASITLDGMEVLKCGGSDDGRPTDDEVWQTLKTRRFLPAKHFSILQIPNDAREFIIKSDVPLGKRGGIVVDCGHRKEMRSLRIIRIPNDEYGREWMVAPEAIDEMQKCPIVKEQQQAMKAPQILFAESRETEPWMVDKIEQVKAEQIEPLDEQELEPVATEQIQAAKTQQSPNGSWALPLMAGVFIGISLSTVFSSLRRPKHGT